jgi:hypothetical protein
MANQEKPKLHRDASGHEQPQSSETLSDKVFPKQRGREQFGTHGGPAKREAPKPTESETDQTKRQ